MIKIRKSFIRDWNIKKADTESLTYYGLLLVMDGNQRIILRRSCIIGEYIRAFFLKGSLTILLSPSGYYSDVFS